MPLGLPLTFLFFFFFFFFFFWIAQDLSVCCELSNLFICFYYLLFDYIFFYYYLLFDNDIMLFYKIIINLYKFTMMSPTNLPFLIMLLHNGSLFFFIASLLSKMPKINNKDARRLQIKIIL